MTGWRAWEEFVVAEQVRVCGPALRAAAVLQPHLDYSVWYPRTGIVIETDRDEITSAAVAAALRSVLRSERHGQILGAGACWITLAEGTEAREVVPAIADAVGCSRPRGENVYSWTKRAVYQTGTRLVVLDGVDRALRGRGIGELADAGLEYLIKDQDATAYVLIGENLCERLTGRNPRLGYYLTRLP